MIRYFDDVEASGCHAMSVKRLANGGYRAKTDAEHLAWILATHRLGFTYFSYIDDDGNEIDEDLSELER